MSKIGENVLKKLSNDISRALQEKCTDISEAYIKMGDQTFSLAIKVVFKPDDEGTKYEARLSFPSGAKVEKEFSRVVDEDQMTLFDSEEEYEEGLVGEE